ncbi:CotH kinase family protein, partial [bacterium]|nr:CotH kinase family protein [bacterium]
MYQAHGNFQSGYQSRRPLRTAAMFFASFLVFLAGLILTGELRADDVRRYEITCNEEDLLYILENPLEDIYIDCIFRFGHIVRDDARLRLRGESSRLYPKKSFKVNFDRDHPFENRDKMNLVSEYLDPTFVQEFLAYDFYARAGLPASVAQFARLYINDRYYGLYLDVEQVDEYFLARADLPMNMSIYKAEEENSCLRLSDVLENYFTRETNDSTDFDDFYAFVNAINTAPEETFRETLESYMDLPTLARVIAVNSLLANGSTYYHNYYLAQDISAGGQWLYLPWDMDRTFYTYGSHLAYDRAGHPLFGANTLIWRCWADSPIRDLIFQQYDALSQSLFTESVFQTAIDTLIPFLYDAVLEDTFAQYDIDDFTYNAGLIPSFVASRVSFMEERRAQAPLPFGPRGSTVSSCGVLLEWQPAQDAAASPIT